MSHLLILTVCVCVLIPGGREQASVPQASTQGHHSYRDAETDQVPITSGEYCQEHRCVFVFVCDLNRLPCCVFSVDRWLHDANHSNVCRGGLNGPNPIITHFILYRDIRHRFFLRNTRKLIIIVYLLFQQFKWHMTLFQQFLTSWSKI